MLRLSHRAEHNTHGACRFGWLSDAPICSWYGITCSDQGRVHAIDLSYNGIDGFIPPEIGELTELTSLNLNGSRPESYTGCAEQNLHGTGFPESFWKLIRLRDLNAEYCCLGGTLSPRIGQLKELRTLALHSNYIHGPIPQTVSALTRAAICPPSLPLPYPILTHLTHLLTYPRIGGRADEARGLQAGPQPLQRRLPERG